MALGPDGTEILSTSPTKNPYIFKIHKYNILSQYKLTYKHMVSGLTTWYQMVSLGAFLWEKAFSPALSTPHLAVVLCRKLRSHASPPLHICMFLVSSLSKSFSVKYGDETR